jgi:hypothetical protein
MTKRTSLRLGCAVAVSLASLLGLLACGNGDDNSSATPGIDAGPQLGTVGDGNPGTLCYDGGFDAGDATLTPYNTCSLYSAGCVPFDPARVPIHPML